MMENLLPWMTVVSLIAALISRFHYKRVSRWVPIRQREYLKLRGRLDQSCLLTPQHRAALGYIEAHLDDPSYLRRLCWAEGRRLFGLGPAASLRYMALVSSERNLSDNTIGIFRLSIYHAVLLASFRSLFWGSLFRFLHFRIPAAISLQAVRYYDDLSELEYKSDYWINKCKNPAYLEAFLAPTFDAIPSQLALFVRSASCDPAQQ